MGKDGTETNYKVGLNTFISSLNKKIPKSVFTVRFVFFVLSNVFNKYNDKYKLNLK